MTASVSISISLISAEMVVEIKAVWTRVSCLYPYSLIPTNRQRKTGRYFEQTFVSSDDHSDPVDFESAIQSMVKDWVWVVAGSVPAVMEISSGSWAMWANQGN
jgi:hypothetical protein